MQRYAPTPRQMLWGILGAFVLLLLFVGLGYALTSVPSANSLSTSQATQLFYSDGKTPLARLGAFNRTNVPLSQVPLVVQHAVLAAEDRNFYSEPGISPTGILRALYVDLKGGDVQQGGSTITQQYVKNAYLTQQRTFTRKFKEIFIAIKLGNSESKSTILQSYLNTIYFGRNAYGIEAASKAYFGVDVSKLDAAEGAVLASVIRAPSFYDPAVNKAADVARWHYVIDGMAKKHWLPASEAAQVQYPVAALKKGKPASASGDCINATFFICQAVKAELASHGFEEARLTAGGYRVVTTIDKTAQAAARQAMVDHHGQLQTSGPDRGREAALVSVAPGDGAIRAMYGGSGGCSNNTLPDNCTDLTGVTAALGGAGDYTRSPGSSFKPYTLIAALQQGISLDSRYNGPPQVQVNGATIHNSGGESCNNCTLTQALAQSINTIFVPLAQKVGPDKVADAAQAAGIPAKRIRRPEDIVPSLTLGVAAVSPLDQAVGYATIAAQGMYAKPYLVQTVKTDGGNTVYKAKKDASRVFDQDVMADTTYAMTKVFDCSLKGTACGRSLSGRPAAGKTGTNGEGAGQNNFDAWFIGFTPQLATAVWYGNYDRNKPVTDGGAPMFGSGAALTWQDMMSAALAGQPVEQFPPPAHVGKAAGNESPTATASSTSPTPSDTISIAPSVTPTLTPSGSLPPLTSPSDSGSPSEPPSSSAPAAGGGGTPAAQQSGGGG